VWEGEAVLFLGAEAGVAASPDAAERVAEAAVEAEYREREVAERRDGSKRPQMEEKRWVG
jgi:hypothetical protein